MKINLPKAFFRKIFTIFTSILFLILFFLIILIIPRTIILISQHQNIYKNSINIPESDVIIVFGTLVREGKISPLLKERLESAKILLQSKKGKKILVSNTELGANRMKQYLLDNDVNEDLIEVDINAETTLDTCKYEKQHNKDRTKIFVTQSFHLSRVLYQCNKIGVSGVGFSAESADINKPQYSSLLKVRVRTWRYLRESLMIWFSLVGIYR